MPNLFFDAVSFMEFDGYRRKGADDESGEQTSQTEWSDLIPFLNGKKGKRSSNQIAKKEREERKEIDLEALF